MFLLDTNIASELRRLDKANSNVRAWASRTDETTMFLSVVTLQELEIGTLRLERRDRLQGEVLREWLNEFIFPTFANRILPITQDVAMRCAGLHVPDPRPELDALIAATALVHGLTVITRNVSDFLATGVPVLNPFESDPKVMNA